LQLVIYALKASTKELANPFHKVAGMFHISIVLTFSIFYSGIAFSDCLVDERESDIAQLKALIMASNNCDRDQQSCKKLVRQVQDVDQRLRILARVAIEAKNKIETAYLKINKFILETEEFNDLSPLDAEQSQLLLEAYRNVLQMDQILAGKFVTEGGALPSKFNLDEHPLSAFRQVECLNKMFVKTVALQLDTQEIILHKKFLKRLQQFEKLRVLFDVMISSLKVWPL